jgi:hypothetical protein
VLATANGALFPGRPGWGSRAEALGIRAVLLDQPLPRDHEDGFTLVGRFGLLALYRRAGGSGEFGLGCVRERWRGTNRELDASLRQALEQPGDAGGSLNPTRWIALEPAPEPLARSSRAEGCDPSTAALEAETSAVGHHEVTVRAAAPTDLVLRATASPSWRFTLDGAQARPELVAPGYFALHVPPGTHRIAASHHYRAVTLLGFALALLGPALGALGHSLWQRWSRRRATAAGPAAHRDRQGSDR